MSSSQQLVDELARLAVDQGAAAPSVRGGDWRLATVASVGSGGTVTTTDGIVARRLDSYELPAVGDLIRIDQSGTGSWLALGRTAPATGDGWQTPTFTSPWANYAGANYRQPRFRRVGQEVIIEGLAGTGGTSVTGTSTVFTLPVGYRPDDGYAFPSITSTGASRQLNIFATGLVQFTSLPAGAVSYISLNCRFSLI
ncbi:hypothetical protein [Streptomyces sp. NPDC002913]